MDEVPCWFAFCQTKMMTNLYTLIYMDLSNRTNQTWNRQLSVLQIQSKFIFQTKPCISNSNKLGSEGVPKSMWINQERPDDPTYPKDKLFVFDPSRSIIFSEIYLGLAKITLTKYTHKHEHPMVSGGLSVWSLEQPPPHPQKLNGLRKKNRDGWHKSAWLDMNLEIVLWGCLVSIGWVGS